MTTSVKTISQVCKVIVEASINQDYIAECVEGATIASIYHSEYGLWNGKNPKACESYLRGLPSVCEVPYMNFHILQILEEEGIEAEPKEDFTEGKERLIEEYWKECGKAFYNLIK